jgi:hypothetical protein
VSRECCWSHCCCRETLFDVARNSTCWEYVELCACAWKRCSLSQSRNCENFPNLLYRPPCPIDDDANEKLLRKFNTHTHKKINSLLKALGRIDRRGHKSCCQTLLVRTLHLRCYSLSDHNVWLVCNSKLSRRELSSMPSPTFRSHKSLPTPFHSRLLAPPTCGCRKIKSN